MYCQKCSGWIAPTDRSYCYGGQICQCSDSAAPKREERVVYVSEHSIDLPGSAIISSLDSVVDFLKPHWIPYKRVSAETEEPTAGECDQLDYDSLLIDYNSLKEQLTKSEAENEKLFAKYADRDHEALLMGERLDKLQKAADGLRSAYVKAREFLDNDIAMLPCESRQRELPEEVWETAMWIRDQMDIALKSFDSIVGKGE